MIFKRGLISVAAAAVLVASPAVSSGKSADVAETAALVRACKSEATKGHFKHVSSQRSEIEAHKQRKSILCDEWNAVTASGQDAVAKKCKSEAAWGARHVHRGGNADRSHMVRLQSLCHRLARRFLKNS